MAHKFYDEVKFCNEVECYHELVVGKIELCKETLNKHPSKPNSNPYIDFKDKKSDDYIVRLGTNFGMKRLDLEGSLFINTDLVVQGKIQAGSLELTGTNPNYTNYTICCISEDSTQEGPKLFRFKDDDKSKWSFAETFNFEVKDYKICRIQFAIDANNDTSIQSFEASIAKNMATTMFGCYDTNKLYYYFLEIQPMYDEVEHHHYCNVLIKWINSQGPDVSRIRILKKTLFY